MKRKILLLSLVAALLLITVSSVGASTEALTVPWSVIGGGGGTITGGTFTISSTIGQPVTGWTLSATYDVCSGFWCRMNSWVRLMLPLVMRE